MTQPKPSITEDILSDLPYVEGPEWATSYVMELACRIGYPGKIMVATLQRYYFDDYAWGTSQHADAGVAATFGGTSFIFLPIDIIHDQRAYAVLRHEFYHILHEGIDRFVRDRLSADDFAGYMRLVERYLHLMEGMK